MRKAIILIWIMLFYQGLKAGDLKSPDIQKNVIRYTQSELDIMGETALQNTRVTDINLYNEIISAQTASVKSVSDEVGDVHTFTVMNLETSSYYSVDATLRAKGSYTQVWVENSSWAAGYVDITVVNSILDNLENGTPEASIDPNKGIYEIDTEIFGNPPNVDGDGYVDFLVLDIQDGYDGSGGFVAGFFFSGDQNGYNNRDLLYLDSYPGIYQNGNKTIETVMSTTAHEFQHLIHYNYDTDEDTWLNEAMSQLAGTLCGYGVDGPGEFFAAPDIDLTTFGNYSDDGVLLDYYKVNVWALYMFERFGAGFIGNIVQNSSNGVYSVDVAFTASGILSSFNESYTNWILCNYINDVAVDSRWGYVNEEMSGLRVSVTDADSYPFNAGETVQNLGADYYRFTLGDTLHMTFSSGTAFARLISKTDTGVEVELVNSGAEIIDNEFGNTVSEKVLVIGSLDGNAAYSVSALASSDFSLVDLKYDDGTADQLPSGPLFLGLGDDAANYGWAVEFTLPENDGNYLSAFKVYSQIGTGATGDVLIHLWNNLSGYPGGEIITPVSAVLVDGWNEINMIDLLGTTLSLPDKFFIGFTQASAATEVYVGVDNSVEENHTWLIRPAPPHSRLSDLDSEYQGYNMMLRVVVGIAGGDVLPQEEGEVVFENNHPNPFRAVSGTYFDFTVEQGGHVVFEIYNLLGQKIVTLIDDDLSPTSYQYYWDGSDEKGFTVSTGVYFGVLRYGSQTKTVKMLVVR